MPQFVRTALSLVLLTVALFAGQTAQADGIAKGPYLMKPTQTSIIVCWVTDTATTGSIEYAPAMRLGDKTTVAEIGDKVRYHRVLIKELKPYTRYQYIVTCDDQKSPLAYFLTAAPRNQSFKFIAYGDTRTNPTDHAAVINRMTPFQPDFVLQSGDLVANGENEDHWKDFWRVATRLMQNTPYYPTLGNHERNGAPYFKYFDVPRDYSFDYGNTHFVAIDTNHSEAEFAAQNEFLRKDLAAHQDATWRVVFMHHTLYTCVDKPERRSLSVILRKRLEPILRAGKVQLVISGHDHCYQRHLPPSGITYLVSGGGGAPLYSVTPDTPYVKVAKSVHNNVEIMVKGNTMTVRAVAPDGGVIDSFVLNAK